MKRERINAESGFVAGTWTLEFILLAQKHMDTEIEIEFIRLFVRPEKVDRLVTFAGKSKTRPKMVNAFNSPGIFEPSRISSYEAGDRTLDNLLSIFGSHGMKDNVYVISESDDWDGLTMETREILGKALGRCTDTIGYCSHSKTAFYEWHHSGATYLLSMQK